MEIVAVFMFMAFLLIGLLGVASIVFWVWMIVDCATKEKSEGNEKLIWILIIVLTGWIGALIYFFVRRPQRVQELGK